MSEQPCAITFDELISRGILEIGDGYRAKLEELGGDGFIFLRAGLLGKDGFNWAGAERFRAEIGPKLRSKLSRPGDTLVTTKGNSVGRTGHVPVESPTFVYSPHLSYWRTLDASQLASRFLYYWSRSTEFIVQLQAMAHGTDMAPYLSLSDQRRLVIRLPEVSVQNSISEILGALDDKIGVNGRIAGTGDALAVASGSEEKWTSRVPLGRIVDHVKEQVFPETLAADRVAHYSIPAYDATRMPERVHPGLIKSGKFQVAAACVLVSKLNPSAPRAWNVTPSPHMPALASTEFLVLRPHSGLSTGELWAVCCQPSFVTSLARKASGTSTSHQRVKPNDLLATEVVDPRGIPAEVRLFISSTARRSHQARFESLALSELRDVLLPQLMSGAIRVRDAERIVEDAT